MLAKCKESRRQIIAVANEVAISDRHCKHKKVKFMSGAMVLKIFQRSKTV